MWRELNSGLMLGFLIFHNYVKVTRIMSRLHTVEAEKYSAIWDFDICPEHYSKFDPHLLMYIEPHSVYLNKW